MFVQYFFFLIRRLLDEVLFYQYFKGFTVRHTTDFVQAADLSNRCLLVDLIKV